MDWCPRTLHDVFRDEMRSHYVVDVGPQVVGLIALSCDRLCAMTDRGGALDWLNPRKYWLVNCTVSLAQAAVKAYTQSDDANITQ